MSKPINMATGGLMSMPPYIEKYEEKDEGITPYDVKTPESARKGLPARLLGKTRTRFSKGKEVKKKKEAVPIWTEEEWEEMNAKKGKIKEKKILLASTDFDKALAEEIKMEEEEFNIWVRENNKRIRDKNKKALGGLMHRTRFNKGNVAFKDPDDFQDDDDRNPDDGYPYPGDSKFAENVKDKLINKQIRKLENQKEVIDDTTIKSKIDNQIKKLKSMKSKVTAALGGYMDENDIAEQTPLALNIGGAVGRVEERKDYQAYAEGDIVDDEAVVEDENLLMEDGSLLTPVGIEDDMMLAETNAEMTAEDEALDDIDADAVLDTSMLSEEEEIVLDEAIEMHPELEAIIPKIVATEFTEDELVEGPGDGTSDSIPAMLSDGEFVFTAKAVKSLGVDKLRSMMAQAEESYDAGQVSQEEAALGAEESLLA